MTFNSNDKLNSYHLSGSVGLAAICATLCQSVTMFFVVAGALIAVSVYTGQVRHPKRRNGRRRN